MDLEAIERAIPYSGDAQSTVLIKDLIAEIRRLRSSPEKDLGREGNKDLTASPREWVITGLGQHGTTYVGGGPKLRLNESVVVREVPQSKGEATK